MVRRRFPQLDTNKYPRAKDVSFDEDVREKHGQHVGEEVFSDGGVLGGEGDGCGKGVVELVEARVEGGVVKGAVDLGSVEDVCQYSFCGG